MARTLLANSRAIFLNRMRSVNRKVRWPPDSQHDSQAGGQVQTQADVDGLPILLIELRRTLPDTGGH
jgi:hypothetical protein